jgi:hypothetical protein
VSVCVDVSGHWRVVPNPSTGWADVAIDFKGRELVDAPGGTPKVHGVDETLVLSTMTATGYGRRFSRKKKIRPQTKRQKRGKRI